MKNMTYNKKKVRIYKGTSQVKIKLCKMMIISYTIQIKKLSVLTQKMNIGNIL